MPATIGVEAAGVIEAVGIAVNDWVIGDRVGYYFSLGAYAERRLIDQRQLVKLPDDITFDQAASLLAKGLTAQMLVKQAYPIQPGYIVLVHAVSSSEVSSRTTVPKAYSLPTRLCNFSLCL